MLSRRLLWRLFKMSFQLSAALTWQLLISLIRIKRKWSL